MSEKNTFKVFSPSLVIYPDLVDATFESTDGSGFKTVTVKSIDMQVMNHPRVIEMKSALDAANSAASAASAAVTNYNELLALHQRRETEYEEMQRRLNIACTLNHRPITDDEILKHPAYKRLVGANRGTQDVENIHRQHIDELLEKTKVLQAAVNEQMTLVNIACHQRDEAANFINFMGCEKSDLTPNAIRAGLREWTQSKWAVDIPATRSAILEVQTELTNARANWPAFNSAHEAMAVLDEERDELWDHVKVNQKRRDLPAMRKEAIQVAAMAIRFADEVCDEINGRK